MTRRTTSEGWIIDVSPEGMRPDVPTRIFPGVQQPLAIAIFTRRPDCDPNTPAPIHYTALHGIRADKYAALATLGLDDDHWRDARTTWQAPFTPAADTAWDDYPAVNDLLPWSAPGIKPNRTWVYAPLRKLLSDRLRLLASESDPERKARLFKETSSSNLQTPSKPLGGTDTHSSSGVPFSSELPSYALTASIVRVGYRFLDRQWLVADRRLMHRPSPDLWAARRPGQVFVVEQHAKPISSGPGLLFSALIPDMDHFKGSEGGRALPLLHPGSRPNLAKGLLDVLSTLAGSPVAAEDVVAYMAGVTAHPGFTERFADELTTPGVRVPITADPSLFREAVELGREVVWAHTYGAAFADPSAGRSSDDVRLPADDERRVVNLTAVTSMPTTMAYDSTTRTLELGGGSFGPVPEGVWEYTVGGKNVLRAWFNYRKADPTGRRSSPLDDVNAESWPAEWTGELLDLLSVLVRLADVHVRQADLLDRVLAGPLASREMLAGAGVSWPDGDKDAQRKPDYSAPKFSSSDDGGDQLGFTFS